MPDVFDHGSIRNWSARQDLHLRSLGPRPSALLLRYALMALTSVSSGQEKRRTPTLARSCGKLVQKIGAPGGTCTHTLPADNGLLFCSATGAMKWWEALVMLQSSLPTVICDTGFTDRQPDHLPEIGSGDGSCTRGGRVYEARLNLILPAIKWWSPAGNAPA